MQNLDYIIVGLGIAGLSFCEQLQKHNKQFIVFDTTKNSSTIASGGVINPTVLKRFTKVWNADTHFYYAISFYDELSKKLKIKIKEEMPLLRILNSVEEQNNWVVASDKKGMASYLSSDLIKNSNPYINAPFGFGKVLGTGRINPSILLKAYREYLSFNNQFKTDQFDYEQLQERDDKIIYKEILAKKIIFAEGASVLKNPFFPKGILIANKGEYIIIKATKLKLEVILKSSVFIIPLGNDLYKVGATYGRGDHSHHTTETAKKQLKAKLAKILSCPFDVVDQITGIRPTTRDRRPLLGTLENSSCKVFFSGLGNRGLISAPSLAKNLYDHLEFDVPLSSETNIKRHYHW